MDIKVRELSWDDNNYIAIGLDSHYLPVYHLMARGYYAAKGVSWWSLTKFVNPDRIGAEEILNEDTIEDRYGLLMDAEPQPTKPYGEEGNVVLPLHRTPEPLTGNVS